MVGGGSEQVDRRDVVVSLRGGGLNFISEKHVSYMPLQYPLLFSCGEDGWYHPIPHRNSPTNFVTMAEFYAYRLQQRPVDGVALLRGGRLLQQYIVDAYAAI